jgi:hypothetical protein
MIRHGYVYLFDMLLRQAWYPKATLSQAQTAHALRRRPEFVLDGN